MDSTSVIISFANFLLSSNIHLTFSFFLISEEHLMDQNFYLESITDVMSSLVCPTVHLPTHLGQYTKHSWKFLKVKTFYIV